MGRSELLNDKMITLNYQEKIHKLICMYAGSQIKHLFSLLQELQDQYTNIASKWHEQ